jgi:hypothetical protein
MPNFAMTVGKSRHPRSLRFRCPHSKNYPFFFYCETV